MEFVVVQPNTATSPKTKRQINKHIARTSHRRLRKLRVDQYQNSRVEKASEETAHTIAEDNAVVSRHRTVAGWSPEPVTSFVPAAKDMAPFGELLSKCAPIEKFMLHYYASVVLPYINVHCPIMDSLGREHNYFRNNWVFLASRENEYYRGFLLSACRHLSLVRQEHRYADLAVEYKLQYISEQRKNVAAGGSVAAARSAITMALVLGFDEIMLGDLNLAFIHIMGAAEIIKAAGGPKVLGLSKFIRYVLYHCLHGDRLLSWNPLMGCSSSFMKPYLALPLIKDA